MPPAAAIADHCRERLPPFKIPTVIHLLQRIRRTAAGTMRRERVAAIVAGSP